MSANEQTDMPKPRKPAPGSAAARAAERARLTQAAAQMRGTATETAATALTALLDLAHDRSGAAHLHGMAAVIAREVCQRARNVDREVAHLIAGLDTQRTSKAG
jgi:hypothetical protein